MQNLILKEYFISCNKISRLILIKYIGPLQFDILELCPVIIFIISFLINLPFIKNNNNKN